MPSRGRNLVLAVAAAALLFVLSLRHSIDRAIREAFREASRW